MGLYQIKKKTELIYLQTQTTNWDENTPDILYKPTITFKG